MASLKLIAAEVGVSYTVVSKVLSGRLGQTRVSKATYDAIIKKAAELNYTPNRLAVALKAGRRGAVSIFLHHFGTAGSDLVDRLLRGVSSGLDQSGLRMWLRFFNTDEEFLTACDTRLKAEVDGLIIAGHYHPGLMPKLRDLVKEGMPLVFIGDGYLERVASSMSYVAVNYQTQGYLATQHLLEQGCRQLACLATHEDRTKGFIQAHKKAGVRIHPQLIVETENFSLAAAEESIERLFGLGLPFDGVVCHSDTQAFAMINALVDRDIEVPKEVRVTGVDDSPLAELCRIPITSSTSQMQQAGLAAVEMLLKLIESEPVKSVTLEPELVVRQSSFMEGETPKAPRKKKKKA
jgi:LacI family transcriptional regulator